MMESKCEDESKNEIEETHERSTDSRFIDDYVVHRTIGEGSYGEAFLCTHKLDGGHYVVKKIPFVAQDRKKTVSKVVSLRMAEHENVVRYYQSWIEEDGTRSGSKLFIVMDYYPRTLLSMLDNLKEKLHEDEIVRMMKQLMKGLEYLHRKNLVHLDLKPDNIFVDQSNNLFIGDFGLSGEPGASLEMPYTVYQAPELKYRSNLSNKVDVYAAGAVLIDMLSAPDHASSAQAHEDAAKKIFPFVESTVIREMLKCCLEKDPVKRASASIILSMIS